jgi:hypothetical protein
VRGRWPTPSGEDFSAVPSRDAAGAVIRIGFVRAILGGPALVVLAVFVAAATASTPRPSHHSIRIVIDGRSIARRFARGPSISFRYPANWHVTTRRLDNVLDPHTLFAASTYQVPSGTLDNCDGTRASGRPRDGAFVLMKEVLDGASLRRSLPRLPSRPRQFRLPPRGQAAGCLPPASALYQFRVGKRAFYIWMSIGPRASAATRQALARLLNRMWIARYLTR